MKKIIVLISLIALFLMMSTNRSAISLSSNSSTKDSIHVWSSAELVEISKTWVGKYQEKYPEVNMTLKLLPENEFQAIINTAGNIALLTKNYNPNQHHTSLWRMAVGREIIVPIINSNNPFKDELCKKGISPAEFRNAFSNPEKQHWGTLADTDQSFPVKFYYDDESVKYLSKFLKADLSNINGKPVSGVEDMLNEVQNDIYALGFCRLVNVIDDEHQKMKESFMLVPIDINGNNKVDYIEDIYKNINYLTRGVWIGKYPKALYSSIYTVAGMQPSNEDELAFLEWVITEGQQYLYGSGYSELIFSERESQLQDLYAKDFPLLEIQRKSTSLISMPFVLVSALIGVFILILVLKHLKSRKQNSEVDRLTMKLVFEEQSVNAPAGLFFDKSHTWTFMEKDGNVRIGVDDFLQQVIGPITRVKMKKPGDIIKKGEAFLSLIQYGKKLEIRSPITGIIKENNIRLESASSLINNSPYLSGWVYVMESANWLNEIKYFFMGEAYKNWIKNEFSRLKDFLSSLIYSKRVDDFQFIMQDGGELKSGLMEEFGPEVWEEFQTAFINSSK